MAFMAHKSFPNNPYGSIIMHNVRQASYLGQDLMPWFLGELRGVHKFGTSSAKPLLVLNQKLIVKIHQQEYILQHTTVTLATSLTSCPTQETKWDAFNLAYQLPRLWVALSTTIC